MASMKLDIITAERIVYASHAEVLVAPGLDGELGILPRHAPLLSALKAGEIRIVVGGDERFIAVSGGFLEVLNNTVTVLADTAEHSDEIDEERAELALKRAQERIMNAPADMDLERAMAALRRSEIRVAVSKRSLTGRRRRQEQPQQPNAS